VRTKELPRECATNTIWYLQGDVLLKVAEIWKLAKACVEDTVVLLINVKGVRRMAAQTLLRKEVSVILMERNRKTSQPKEPSAGCIFKNFFASDIEAVNKELFARAEADKKIRGGKIGAGYLIEQVNLKGTISGGAQISKQHANFLVNKNNAKAADVLALIKLIKERVKEEFGVDMEEEVQYLGF
jgi:UDP-N-acetylmuramate dehydrogenase